MVNAMDFGSSFDHKISIKRSLMKDNMTICPTPLEIFEYPQKNGQTKVDVSISETPAH